MVASAIENQKIALILNAVHLLALRIVLALKSISFDAANIV